MRTLYQLTDCGATSHMVSFHIASMEKWPDATLLEWSAIEPANLSPAFETLMARYRPWIIQRCRFHLGSDQDAQDVAQEVMVRAYQNLAQLRDKQQFKAWLRVILTNCCHRFIARRSRYSASEDVELMIDSDAVGERDELMHLEEQEAVGYVIDQLPVVAREVITLRFFEAYSLEQIAQHLEVSLSAAKARLYRALALFNAVFEREYDNK